MLINLVGNPHGEKDRSREQNVRRKDSKEFFNAMYLGDILGKGHIRDDLSGAGYHQDQTEYENGGVKQMPACDSSNEDKQFTDKEAKWRQTGNTYKSTKKRHKSLRQQFRQIADTSNQLGLEAQHNVAGGEKQ